MPTPPRIAASCNFEGAQRLSNPRIQNDPREVITLLAGAAAWPLVARG
jgi:hypothetical protein